MSSSASPPTGTLGLQQRLKLKQTPIDTWSLSEQLNLATAVLRSGDQNWVSVSRAMKSDEARRPPDWFSQKNCALQYNLLLNQVEVPRRKRSDPKVEGVESPGESIVRRLRADRIKEIQGIIQIQTEEIKNIEEELELLKPESGATQEQIDEIARRIMEEDRLDTERLEKEKTIMKEREEKKLAIQTALKTVKVPSAPSSPTKGGSGLKTLPKEEKAVEDEEDEKIEPVEVREGFKEEKEEEKTEEKSKDVSVEPHNPVESKPAENNVEEELSENVEIQTEEKSPVPVKEISNVESDENKKEESLDEKKEEEEISNENEDEKPSNVNNGEISPTVQEEEKEIKKEVIEEENIVELPCATVSALNEEKELKKDKDEEVRLEEKVDISSSETPESSTIPEKELLEPSKEPKEEKQTEDVECTDESDSVVSKRATRAAAKKEMEPAPSKAPDETESNEDHAKNTRRRHKRTSEKSDEDSLRKKTPIKNEDEPLMENLIENRRLSRVKDDILSGPSVTRSSRRGSSRSSSPTGSVIVTEDYSEYEPRTRPATRRKSGKVTPAESEHESVPPSPAPSEEDNAWKKTALSALEEIKSFNYDVLENPPSPEGVIKKPLDLAIIAKNVDSGIIKNLLEFQRDIQLLLLNIFMVVSSSSEMSDILPNVQTDIDQVLSSLSNSATCSSKNSSTSHKRKRTSSALSTTDSTNTSTPIVSSKSKRRKTRGDD